MNIFLERAQGTSLEAQSFSTMAGVLAALMFASIIFIMSNPPKGKNSQDYSPYILILFSSFYLLLFSTFLYIPVSGSKFWPEQEITFLLASFVLAVAMCQIFYGMLWIFESYGFGTNFIISAKFIFRSVVLLVAINAIGTMYNVLNNINRFFEDNIKVDDSTILYKIIPLLLISPSVGAFFHWAKLSKHDNSVFRRISIGINFIAIAFSILVGFYFVYIFTFWQSGLISIQDQDDFLAGIITDNHNLYEPWLLEYLKWILPSGLACFLLLYELGMPRSRK